jgi:hypothetical protein
MGVLPKVLFICKERTNFYSYGYGNSVGLMNSSRFVINYLEEIDIESKLSVVKDANGIDKEVFDYNPTHVILEALWVTPKKIQELLSIKRYKKITWIIRLHSKISFISSEGIAFTWITGYVKLMKDFKNLFVSVNSFEFTEDLEKIFFIKSLYLPNIYLPKEDIPVKVPVVKDYIDIGCFGAIRPFKNILTQAIAAIEYGEELEKVIHFHVNSDRQEQSGDNVYKNLKALFAGTKHKLIDHSWLSHKDFVKVVVQMDVGLQVSLSETFNIVAADFIFNGVPLIGSKDITWLPEMFQADPNSSEDILEKIRFIIDTKDFDVYKLNNIYLDWYNRKAKKVWRDYLLYNV